MSSKQSPFIVAPVKAANTVHTESVYIVVTGEPHDEEDAHVAGAYLVEVDSSLADEQKASAALDCFHESFGIENLDPFSFSVYNAKGVAINEAIDSETYKMGHLANFCGAINQTDLPVLKG